MDLSEAQYAGEKLDQLRSMFQVEIEKDWGDEQGAWKDGIWSRQELEKLHSTLMCLADCLGGPEKLQACTGGVTVHREEMGRHGGEALAHRVSFSTRQTFSAWTVVHEFAHAWDANHKWKLSRLLESYTGGHTNPVSALAMRLTGQPDCGVFGQEDKPGRRGRKPGCNRAGYFYGDRPSGSNWNFNRVEDFAEAVAMYVGWERGNELSSWAKARLDRYLLADGEKSKLFGVDRWSYYRQFFYPENGDYAKTRRWQFVDELVRGKITVQ